MNSTASQSSRSGCVGGAPRDDLYVAGSEGRILHYDGKDWVLLHEDGFEDWNALWYRGGTELLVAGESGAIARMNGDTLTELHDAGAPVYDIAGRPGGEFAVAGAGGLLLWFDGSEWTTIDCAGDENLYGVYLTEQPGLFAAGSSGVILFDDFLAP